MMSLIHVKYPDFWGESPNFAPISPRGGGGGEISWDISAILLKSDKIICFHSSYGLAQDNWSVTICSK